MWGWLSYFLSMIALYVLIACVNQDPRMFDAMVGVGLYVKEIFITIKGN